MTKRGSIHGLRRRRSKLGVLGGESLENAENVAGQSSYYSLFSYMQLCKQEWGDSPVPTKHNGVPCEIDLNRLFKLRLVVARYGEMDGARWWNTNGMLGSRGAAVLRRGFPATHFFAQARVVFQAARGRCREVYDPPGAFTLWHLPATVEDQFDDAWQEWLDHSGVWEPFFEQLAERVNDDLVGMLSHFDLLSEQQLSSVARLRRTANGRAVSLSGVHTINDDSLTLLAAAFSRGEPGNLAVPFARLDDSEA